MPARLAAPVAGVVLLACLGASASAKPAGREPSGCVLIADRKGDQPLVNSGVSNDGMGPASLDIRHCASP